MHASFHLYRQIAFLMIALLLGFPCPVAGAGEKITVFAAASMQDVLAEIISSYESNCDCEIVLSVAGTSALARQIEAGAPADVFISADRLWMDYLLERKLVRSESVVTIAENKLVIASHLDVVEDDPKALLGRGRFAMADPSGVPAGLYAKTALETIGLWEEVQENAVFTENVRIALKLAARGDVQSSIVYGSDVRVEPELRIAYTFTQESHQPIRYPAAVTENASRTALAFLHDLESAEARAVFLKAGFSIPESNEY